MINLSDSIAAGYSESIRLAKKHYENFPVISLLIPKEYRRDISIIYWFARSADDIADEGNLTTQERLRKLSDFENRLISVLKNSSGNNLELALRNSIIERKLTQDNFFNLLKAFKQDVTKSRYNNFNEVLNYCSNSANPVGRILLELFNITESDAIYYSDRICTALQITNFIQDTKTDFQKGRIYYPLDEMLKFNVNEKMFEMKKINDNLKSLIEFTVNRTQTMFDEGKALLKLLTGRFRYEIAWTIKGGEEILAKIRGADFDIISKRPILKKSDYLKLLLKTFLI
ncbi:MAG: squalene synthase HpnC [Ignavibacteriota bacterium]|nr:squalene synthase HpnC [Ignavibacteriales bacterium]MBL1124259.1 squalene synthase HpnC [Ignavibacteriota bacterium]MCC7095186.1 squalene synthase HpnC [Ignavibacteriaceae bacterium]MCE7855384.1 squalene synthase HpnC [Ignavibacteria bacterium CHB3]NUM63168.1 squalene synthase HpnC [Ignavibacteriaceae bacterium]